jgi:uncharacterized protein with HEPN domain
MARRVELRLQDIAEAIGHVRDLMDGRSLADLTSDAIGRAAFERFMEIISEASRHVPAAMKNQHPEIPWQDIANFGNILRHAYHRIDPQVLWETYVNDIGSLEAAIGALRRGMNEGDPAQD